MEVRVSMRITRIVRQAAGQHEEPLGLAGLVNGGVNPFRVAARRGGWRFRPLSAADLAFLFDPLGMMGTPDARH
jgi:hypothetical protein